MSDNLTNEEKLNRILALAEENHKLLRSLHRTQFVSNIFRILYWTLIIASLGGAYYFIKPMLSNFTSNNGSIMEQYSTFKAQLPDAKALQQMLNQGGGSQAE